MRYPFSKKADHLNFKQARVDIRLALLQAVLIIFIRKILSYLIVMDTVD
jgi:hypothetical protein